MLSLNPFELGSIGFEDFWSLRVTKEFTNPDYYIGQVVLLRHKVSQGEILFPVEITGISWMGDSWEYKVELPPDHPHFIERDREVEWYENFRLEAM